MEEGLESAGCSILKRADPSEAPFRFSFITPWGDRRGVCAYAFLANSKSTKNRPHDEYRFQIKYGSKDEGGPPIFLWHDPFGLYTTLLLGIDTENEVFIGADPVLNSPTRFHISKEFKDLHVAKVKAQSWFAWERERKAPRNVAPEEQSLAFEIMVGGVKANFLRYVLFESEVRGEDQGHRHLVADGYTSPLELIRQRAATLWVADEIAPVHLHKLAVELGLDIKQILDMIAERARVHMAVRGAAAEHHLRERLLRLPNVTRVDPLGGDGEPDFAVRVSGSRRPVRVECKNTLRTELRGYPKMDFQRTRAPKSNPCGRYYAREEFEVLAACLHAHTNRWEFKARLTRDLPDHAKCHGRIASNLAVDEMWEANLALVLERAVL
jgi:hypothetical protein